MRGKVQNILKFAALFVASAAFSLAPGAKPLAASPANTRAHRAASQKPAHSAKKSIHAPGRIRSSRRGRSRIAAHSSAHARPGVRLARYSRPPQQPSATATTKKKKTRRRRRSRRQSYQKAPTPDRISEIQSALARGGYYRGDPNGKWDSNTVDALQKFQSANGLEPSGKLDASSLQKMGLGSDIAGVSAPKPLPPRGSAPAVTPHPPANPSSPAPPAPKVYAPSTPASSAPSLATPSSASSTTPSPKS
ncbi:MAG: peptidoglycan-binding domain-containing protein [Candidatus Acidiferrales bacterium]